VFCREAVPGVEGEGGCPKKMLESCGLNIVESGGPRMVRDAKGKKKGEEIRGKGEGGMV